MNRLFFLIVTLFLNMLIIDGQPVVGEKDVKKAKAFKVRSFSGESLYGYINGGADLYLEYGFGGVTVTEFKRAKSKFKVEIWEMNDAEAAFGIFSVSRFRCLHRPPFTPLACQNKYQLQVCRDRYYINIINDSGSETDSIISVDLAKKLASAIDEGSPDLESYFPGPVSVKLSDIAYLVKGRLGVLNSAPELEKYIAGAVNYTALFYRADSGWRLSVRFRSDEDMKNYISSASSGPVTDDTSVIKTRWDDPLRRTGRNQVLIDITVTE